MPRRCLRRRLQPCLDGTLAAHGLRTLPFARHRAARGRSAGTAHRGASPGGALHGVLPHRPADRNRPGATLAGPLRKRLIRLSREIRHASVVAPQRKNWCFPRIFSPQVELISGLLICRHINETNAGGAEGLPPDRSMTRSALVAGSASRKSIMNKCGRRPLLLSILPAQRSSVGDGQSGESTSKPYPER